MDDVWAFELPGEGTEILDPVREIQLLKRRVERLEREAKIDPNIAEAY